MPANQQDDKPIRILYVDDYALDRELVRHALNQPGSQFRLTEAKSQTEFEARFNDQEFDLILTDFNISGFEGLQVLEACMARDPNLPVVIVTGTGSEEIAVEAMKRGAADYVIKSPRQILRLPHTIAAALEKQEHRRREQEHTRLREAILAVTTALRQEQTQDGLIAVFIDQLMAILQPKGVAVVMNRPAILQDWIVASRGSWQSWENSQLFSAAQHVRQVLRTGESYIQDENNPIQPGSMPEPFTDIQTESCLALVSQGAILGAVWIGYGSKLNGSELGMLAAICDIAANAIQRAILNENLEQQVKQLTSLHTIDKAITASFNLNVILSVLIDQILQQLKVDAAAVLVYRPITQTMDYAAGQGFRNRAIERASFRLGQPYAGQVVLERRQIRVLATKQELPTTSASRQFFAILEGENFQEYIGTPLIAKGQIKGVLEVYSRQANNRDEAWHEFLTALADQAAIAVDNAGLYDELQRSNQDLQVAYDSTLAGWSRTLELRGRETAGHTSRLSEQAVRMARAFSIPEDQVGHIRRGALLHDIGKLALPDSILFKPGPLDEDEWVLVRQHPTVAYDLLAPIPYLRPALEIPYCHHEWWNGNGYPRGLQGDSIPLAARIFTVLDVNDSLLHDRPYRPAWPADKVNQYLRDQAGVQFDPEVVEEFFKVF